MRAAQEPRVPKRLPCDITVAGLRHSGLVLNVSPRGLFVLTSAEAQPGSEVSIGLTPPHQTENVELRATVVWKRTVPRQMLSAARGGMGLRIHEASEGYYSFLSSVIRSATREPLAAKSSVPQAEAPTRPELRELRKPPARPATPAAPMPKSIRFKVRVSQTSGTRTRFVEVTALSTRQAKRLALREVGEGWQALEVKLA